MSIATVDSMIMGKIIEIISKKDSSIAGIYDAIAPAIPCIIVMVVVKKCLENVTDIFYGITSSVKNIFYKLFYRQKVIENVNKITNCNHYLGARYNYRSQIMLRSFIPIYWNVSEDGTFGYLNYLPFYHSNVIVDCETTATQDFKEYQDLVNLKQTVYKKYSKLGNDLGYIISNASSLYPSKNYTKLVDIISTHFEVSEKVGVYSVIGMLIDGMQGLGKTKFADYAAEHKVAGHVYKIDMTNFLDFDFKTINTKFYHGVDITTNTIFLVDEIDKYLAYRVKIEYEKHTEVCKKNKTDEVPAHKSLKQFTEDTKTTFLYDMLSILERDGLKQSVVVIFCSNNFHTIFEGVDITHHKSLYDRFMKIPFEICDHDEIIAYIMYYNKKFVGSKYYSSVSQEVLSLRLKFDVKVTHRTLHQISIESQYDAIKMIDALNIHQQDDLELLIQRRSPAVSLTKTPPSEQINAKVNIPTILDIPSEKCNGGYSDDERRTKCGKNDKKSSESYDEQQTEHSENDENSEESGESDDERQTKHCENSSKSTISDIEQPIAEHKRYWTNNYVLNTKELTPKENSRVCKTVHEMLNECESTKGRFEKKCVVIRILDYLAVEGIPIVVHHPSFKTTVIDKIKEYHTEDPDVLSELKGETKDFIYAVSGILC